MLGIGVDIIEINRMADILSRSGNIFINRVFTDKERQTGQKHHDPAAYYAKIFAAKEAIFKLFNTCWDQGAGLRDIEVGRNEQGAPQVKLSGYFARLFFQTCPHPKICLSLSSDGNMAIAVAALAQA